MEVMCINCGKFFFVDERLELDGKDVNYVTCSLECSLAYAEKEIKKEKEDVNK